MLYTKVMSKKLNEAKTIAWVLDLASGKAETSVDWTYIGNNKYCIFVSDGTQIIHEEICTTKIALPAMKRARKLDRDFRHLVIAEKD